MVSFWPWGSGSDAQSAQSSTTNATTTLTKPSGVTKETTGLWPWSSPSATPATPPTKAGGPSFPADVLPPIDVLIAQSDAKLSAWSSSPTLLAAASVAVGGIAASGLVFFWARHVRRLRNSDWITPEWLGGQRWVRGKVTSVGDGDNFRFFHTPLFGGYYWPFKLRTVPVGKGELKDETLHIRLAGVDAPESAYFGKPEQPGAAEAKAWLSSEVLGRKVYCQLIRKDQYGRVVAHVHRPWRLIPGSLYRGPNVSEMMLQNGHASVYEQAGAEYGRSGKQGYLSMQEDAKKRKVGLWASEQPGESPAEYKKRYSQSAVEKGSST